MDQRLAVELIGIGVALVMSWALVRHRTEDHERRIDSLEVCKTTRDAQMSEVTTKLAVLESRHADHAERFGEAVSSLQRQISELQATISNKFDRIFERLGESPPPKGRASK